MKSDEPRSFLMKSLIPTLVLFLLGSVLVLLSLGGALVGPFLLLGGGVLAGFLLTQYFTVKRK